MVTVNVFTAEKMQEIADSVIVSAAIVEGVLVFTREDETTFEAGTVVVDYVEQLSNVQAGTEYTLQSSDRETSLTSGVVEMTSDDPNILTLPSDESVSFPINAEGEIRQMGAGQTTIAGETDVIIVKTSATTDFSSQFGIVGWVKVAPNTYLIAGELT